MSGTLRTVKTCSESMPLILLGKIGLAPVKALKHHMLQQTLRPETTFFNCNSFFFFID